MSGKQSGIFVFINLIVVFVKENYSRAVRYVLFGVVLAGILAWVGSIVWSMATKSIYTTRVVGVKTYIGSINPNSEEIGAYVYVKVRFDKPYYAGACEVEPKSLVVKFGDIVDEYVLVRGLRPDRVYFPQIVPANYVLSGDASDAGVVATYSGDFVADEKMEDLRQSECFDDVTEEYMQVPFELEGGVTKTKIFVFKKSNNSSVKYSSNTMGCVYKITGENISTPEYPFVAFFETFNVDNCNRGIAGNVYRQLASRHLSAGDYDKAVEYLDKSYGADKDRPLYEVSKAFLLLNKKMFDKGNDLFYSNIQLVSRASQFEYIYPAIILNLINGRSSDASRLVGISQKLFPNSAKYKELLAVYYFNDGKIDESLVLFDELSSMANISGGYNTLLKKGIVLSYAGKHKLSSEYIQANIGKLKNGGQVGERVKFRMVDCLNFILYYNYYKLGDLGLANKFRSKISSDSYYAKACSDVLRGKIINDIGLDYFMFY